MVMVMVKAPCVVPNHWMYIDINQGAPPACGTCIKTAALVVLARIRKIEYAARIAGWIKDSDPNDSRWAGLRKADDADRAWMAAHRKELVLAKYDPVVRAKAVELAQLAGLM